MSVEKRWREPEMYSAIVKHVLIPAYYRFNKDERLAYLKEIEAEQWLSPREIGSRQFQRVQALLHHAYETAPFYRKSWTAVGAEPGDVTGPAEFQTLPFLSKQDIQNSLKDLVSTNYGASDLIPDASGGSTGIPTNFYSDGINYYKKHSFIYRHDRWSGWDFGQRVGIIWGAQHEVQRSRAFRERLLQKYLFRTMFLDAFSLSDARVVEFIRILNTEKPAILLSYTNAMFLVARLVRQKNLEVHSPKGIIVSAETLTSEKRALIEAVFGCKVLNRYGSREVGMIASECMAQEGLHIASDNIYLEVIKDGRSAKPGELGEIVVTDLLNYAMPLIRYRTGDIGAMSDKLCSCGRGLPILKEVCGRSSDFFVTRSGKFIHGEYFTHLFYGIPAVKRFRITQESRDSVNVSVQPLGEIPPDELRRVVDEVKKVMEGAEVTLTAASEVESVPSGKFMFTVSRVGNPFSE
jgi:phenylacetate-CoA ligase